MQAQETASAQPACSSGPGPSRNASSNVRFLSQRSLIRENLADDVAGQGNLGGHVVHHLRHRSIEDLHQGGKLDQILHDVPLHLALPASDLRQRCWQAPARLFFEAEELRLGASGSSPCSSARAPTPRPWPSSVSLRNGAKTRPKPWRRSSAHAATWSGAVALYVAERRHSTVVAR